MLFSFSQNLYATEKSKLDEEIAKALKQQLGIDTNKNQEPGDQMKTLDDSEESTQRKTATEQKQTDSETDKRKRKQYLVVKQCHDTVIGTVPDEAGKRPKYKHVSNHVYRWIDESGNVHFGARAPDKGNELSSKTFENVYSVNVYEDYFDLEINLDLNSGVNRRYYNKHLYQQIKNMYEVLIELLPKDTLLQVKIKLWVFDSIRTYSKFFRSYYPRSNPNLTLGFYSGRHYIAAARNHSGKEQVVSTSVHEATHVFNHANFGVIPRWLNEGLAEYIEQMSFTYPSFTIKPSQEWLVRIKKTPLTLEQLFSSQTRDWSAGSSLNYYAHGGALIYFLMSSDKGKSALSSVLQQHAVHSCDQNTQVDTRSVLLANYQGGINQLQQDFSKWIYQYKEPHIYKR